MYGDGSVRHFLDIYLKSGTMFAVEVKASWKATCKGNDLWSLTHPSPAGAGLKLVYLRLADVSAIVERKVEAA